MKSRTFALTLALLTAGASFAAAGDMVGETTTAGYHLKKRSTFNAPEQTRTPFWPIGWSPSAAPGTQPEMPRAGFVLNPDNFVVTSILIGTHSLTVINGRSYGEGENLRNPRSKSAAAGAVLIPNGVKIRVQRISDGEVTLQTGTQTVNVPLRRPQLSEPKEPQEDILLQDER